MNNNQKGIALIIIVLIVAAIIGGGILTWQYLGEPKAKKAINENYCEKDADCACGVNINTGGCFYGNKNYVDITRQCPDFCTGITGDLIIRCTDNQCAQGLKEVIPEKIESEKINLLSPTNVYFSEAIQGKISLYSPDAETKIIEYPWCGAPTIGSKEYSGEFYLSFEGLDLNLGEMTFAENSHHDGRLWVKKLNPNNDQDFIIVLQYGSCNVEEARFYGYDFEHQNLIQYKFERKDGKIWNKIYVGPTDDFLEILSSKEFISESYDNSIGRNRVTKWRFNSEKNVFEEVESWLEEL